jgi:hypothetical protein
MICNEGKEKSILKKSSKPEPAALNDHEQWSYLPVSPSFSRGIVIPGLFGAVAGTTSVSVPGVVIVISLPGMIGLGFSVPV